MNRARYYTRLWRNTQEYKRQLKINWLAVAIEVVGIALAVSILLLAGSELLNG